MKLQDAIARAIQSVPTPLPPHLSAAWEELSTQIDWADGHWLGWVTASGLDATLLIDASRTATAGAVEVCELNEDHDEAWVLEKLFAPATSTRLVWVRVDSQRTAELARWRALHLRLNERRERLARAQRGGVVFVAPPGFMEAARDCAPDLWTMRALALRAASPLGQQRMEIQRRLAIALDVRDHQAEVVFGALRLLPIPGEQGLALTEQELSAQLKALRSELQETQRRGSGRRKIASTLPLLILSTLLALLAKRPGETRYQRELIECLGDDRIPATARFVGALEGLGLGSREPEARTSLFAALEAAAAPHQMLELTLCVDFYLLRSSQLLPTLSPHQQDLFAHVGMALVRRLPTQPTPGDTRAAENTLLLATVAELQALRSRQDNARELLSLARTWRALVSQTPDAREQLAMDIGYLFAEIRVEGATLERVRKVLDLCVSVAELPGLHGFPFLGGINETILLAIKFDMHKEALRLVNASASRVADSPSEPVWSAEVLRFRSLQARIEYRAAHPVRALRAIEAALALLDPNENPSAYASMRAWKALLAARLGWWRVAARDLAELEALEAPDEATKATLDLVRFLLAVYYADFERLAPALQRLVALPLVIDAERSILLYDGWSFSLGAVVAHIRRGRFEVARSLMTSIRELAERLAVSKEHDALQAEFEEIFAEE